MICRHWYQNYTKTVPPIPSSSTGRPRTMTSDMRLSKATLIVVASLLTCELAAAFVVLSSVNGQYESAVEFDSTLRAWQADRRYYNPTGRAAVLVSADPECGSCHDAVAELAGVYSPDQLQVILLSELPNAETEYAFEVLLGRENSERLNYLYDFHDNVAILVDQSGVPLLSKLPEQSLIDFYALAAEHLR